MKKKSSINNKSNIKINKKTERINNNKNSNSLSHNFFNKIKNRNKITIILNFLDINEQLPLLQLNSIISKILINKYNLPFKSIESLKQIKNNKTSNEAKYTKLYLNFKNIIEKNNISENEYQFIFSYLLKNINDNYIILDSFSQDNKIADENDFEENVILKKYKIFVGFLQKIQYINKITHIKFKISNLDNQIKDIHLNKEIFNELYFNNFFKNINHLEIDNVENSLCFINKLLSYDNNLISNVTKINLSDINIKMNNEEIIDYDIYKNEIISKNSNLVRIVILQCSNNK